MKKVFEVGNKIHVSGEVYYGNEWYRVDSDGIINDIRTKSMLITLDNIDGDGNACVIVNKKYIDEYIPQRTAMDFSIN